MQPWGPPRRGWKDRTNTRQIIDTEVSRRRTVIHSRSSAETHSSLAAIDDDPKHKLQRTEAVLVLSRGPLTTRKLAALAGLADATEARTLIRQLNKIYDQQERAFRAEEVAGGYQLLTRPQFAPYLRRMGHLPQVVRLSSPMLETLAIVAYRQPILRADIEAIRGVQSGELLRQLMEKELVRISGRSEELGRPYLYSTTRRFLQVFGLRNTDSLPCSEWFQPEQQRPNTELVAETPDYADPVHNSPVKESDVSIAIASPTIDIDADDAEANVVLPNTGDISHGKPVAIIEDEENEDEWESDDEDEDWDDEDEDWDDDGESEEEDVEEDEWEEDDDVEDGEGDWEEVDDDEDEDEDEDDDLEEDDMGDEWVDDEDDDDWEDDDEDEY